MKYISLLLLTLIFILCINTAKAQVSQINNSSGLIVLSENYNKKDFIQFYNQDGSLWHKFSFYYDDSNGKFDYDNEDFKPFAFHVDYFVLALKCVKKQANRYEVVVNERTGLKKFVNANDPTLRFETWEDHILKLFSISFDQTENPMLETLQGQMKNVVLPNMPFHPIKVKGEWLKIKWDTPNETKSDVGWIRWKNGGKLLIEFFYIS